MAVRTDEFYRLANTLDWDHAAEKEFIKKKLIPRCVLIPVEIDMEAARQKWYDTAQGYSDFLRVELIVMAALVDKPISQARFQDNDS